MGPFRNVQYGSKGLRIDLYSIWPNPIFSKSYLSPNPKIQCLSSPPTFVPTTRFNKCLWRVHPPCGLNLAPEAQGFIHVEFSPSRQGSENVLLQPDGLRSVPAVGRLLSARDRPSVYGRRAFFFFGKTILSTAVGDRMKAETCYRKRKRSAENKIHSGHISLRPPATIRVRLRLN